MGIYNPTREEIRKVAEATTAPGETMKLPDLFKKKEVVS